MSGPDVILLRVSPISVTGTWAIIWPYVKVDVRSRCYTSILRVSPISVTGTWGHHLALREGGWQALVLHNAAVPVAVHCDPGAHQPVAEQLVI